MTPRIRRTRYWVRPRRQYDLADAIDAAVAEAHGVSLEACDWDPTEGILDVRLRFASERHAVGFFESDAFVSLGRRLCALTFHADASWYAPSDRALWGSASGTPPSSSAVPNPPQPVRAPARPFVWAPAGAYED
jgi:hypothetical protein